MKIYIFSYHQAVDCEFLGVTHQVFKNEKDALEAFNKWRDDELKYVTDSEWVIEENSQNRFEAYEDGRYCTNHTEGYVEEYVI